MRTIALEEHYASPGFVAGPGQEFFNQTDTGLPAQVPAQLCDLGPGRIAEMDAAGIDLQILSLNSPGVEQLEAAEATALAREANDFVAQAVRAHPNRFSGFAALPTPAPAAAVAELERTVRDHGFMGALINGHVRGRYLDDKFFWPIFECAVALRVPIYLHPTQPPPSVTAALYAGFDPRVTYMLANPAWGWHIDTAVHVLRIILSGVFDRYPTLQLIIGHLGEALPFMISRLDIMRPQMTGLNRPISAYLRENVNYTFGGFNYTSTFLDLLLEVGVDRIMFSTDYPYASMTRGRAFLDHLPVSTTDRERIAHGNAERLLRIGT